jgi:hypothetical protein
MYFELPAENEKEESVGVYEDAVVEFLEEGFVAGLVQTLWSKLLQFALLGFCGLLQENGLPCNRIIGLEHKILRSSS